MIFKHQVTISKTNFDLTEQKLYQQKINELKEYVKKDLKDNGFDDILIKAWGVYIGGSEWCQCPGCAESINHVRRRIKSTKESTLTIEFDTELATRYLGDF